MRCATTGMPEALGKKSRRFLLPMSEKRMSTQALINWLGAALVASLVTMLVSASAGGITPAGASAALFAASIVAASIAVNQPLWQAGPADGSPDRGPKIAQFNARLMALVYAWGSLLLLVVYPLSGMRWYHAYQYGAGTGLFAAGLLAYSICIGSKGSTMRASRALSSVVLLAAIQGLAALGGLAFLI